MNWNLFAKIFLSVGLAEMADKTQLVTLSYAAAESQRGTVFAASALALVVASAAAVLLGGLLGGVFEGPWLRRVVGIVFIAIGVLYLLGRG